MKHFVFQILDVTAALGKGAGTRPARCVVPLVERGDGSGPPYPPVATRTEPAEEARQKPLDPVAQRGLVNSARDCGGVPVPPHDAALV